MIDYKDEAVRGALILDQVWMDGSVEVWIHVGMDLCLDEAVRGALILDQVCMYGRVDVWTRS